MTDTLTVTSSESTRLDQFLNQHKIASSRAQIIKWIKDGHVLVNGKKTKPSIHLKMGDVVEWTQPAATASHLTAEAIDLNIVFEDEDIIVINKSADMVVHPGAGNPSGTLTNALLHHCGKLSQIGGVERPGIVHRLDKGTSGLMVVAKNDKAHLNLSSQFKKHAVEKIYWALVYGRMKKKQGTIKTLIGRSPHHRIKYEVVEKNGKEAVTHYKVIEESEGFSFVEVAIETGRTHQIRVHMNYLGHGIVGDPLYQRRNQKHDKIQTPHPLLHARSLSFEHPVSGKRLSFKASPPQVFEDAKKKLMGIY